MQRNFVAWYLNGSRGGELKDAALVAFVAPNEEDWRFSLVKMDYRFEEGKKGRMRVKEEFTPARRWSFLVGVNENSHTAQSQLVGLVADDEKNPALSQLERGPKITVFIGLFTILSVYFYRKDLELKYSAVITIRIIFARDVNDPQIAIFNFSEEATEIADYKIIFNTESSKKVITKNDLEKELLGEMLPPKIETIFYLGNKSVELPVKDFLEAKSREDTVFCEGYITVKNRIKFWFFGNKKFNFRCARGYVYRDPNKTLFWYTYPGPSYVK